MKQKIFLNKIKLFNTKIKFAGAFRVEMQRETQKERTILCKYDPIEVRIQKINKFFYKCFNLIKYK